MKELDKVYAESLASEYAPKETSKVIALKKLDRKAKSPANIFAYTFGIVSALILGIGMCLSMKVIGNGSTLLMAMGIVIGVLGLLLASINYPIYKKILAKGKSKYAYDIIELAKQITD
jgi:amino acid transporter